ncbi:hypothetical protein BpHYR1_041742 [Brachionus plicatilis]|uniref:Uncharacterized protein n=1 Tax=Brachionus plicatilis TaxID=10195 RepID=A0A3M7SFS7_BRAPC|nr:hypothetical protein BpHYR1_041742 [Brachionus plicatilis]
MAKRILRNPKLITFLSRDFLLKSLVSFFTIFLTIFLFFSFQSSNDVYNAPMDITKKLNVELNKLSFNISNM